MKKRTKLSLAGITILAGALLLTGCTASFCSDNDKAHILYALDYGVSDYYDSSTDEDGEPLKQVFDGNTNIYYKANMPTDAGSGLGKANADASNAGIAIPRNEYFVKLDQLVLKNAVERYALEISDPSITTTTVDYATALIALDKYGYLKYAGDTLWEGYDDLNKEIRQMTADPTSGIILDHLPTNDYINIYKRDMNTLINNYRSCIAISEGKYGYYGYANGAHYREGDRVAVELEAKTWGGAWNVNGKFTFFEGLLVYPIAWLTESFVSGFKNIGVIGGVAQLLAIFAITFIVRSLMLIVTIRQTSGNAKMQALQPEIAKIQNKYPNANTNNYEKQMMAQEMSKLYKKNKINPLSTLLVMIVQFPVFICVWGALQGSASLSSDSLLNLHLSDNINQVLFNGANWANGSAVTALFLFLFMAGAQVVSMLLPQWIQKAKRKKVASLGKNPAQSEQQNRMKMFTYVMAAMIIFMGFMLPSAMGVYWFVGALFSIAQTLIIEKINSARMKKKGK